MKWLLVPVLLLAVGCTPVLSVREYNAQRKIDVTVSTFATGFNGPQGVACAADGTVYVADDDGVKKIVNGVVSTVISDYSAVQVFVTSRGDLFYKNDYGLHLFDFVMGSANVVFGGYWGNVVAATLSDGSMVATQGNQLSRVATDGTVTALGDPVFNSPYHLVFVPGPQSTSGRLYFSYGQVGYYNFDGTKVAGGQSWGTATGYLVDGPSNKASFYSPGSLAVDSTGLVYFVDGNTIRVVTADGDISTLVGPLTDASGYLDGPGLTALLSGPRQIAVGPDDSLYIADLGNNVIRKVTFLEQP